MEQRALGGILSLLRVVLTSASVRMHRKWASRSRFVRARAGFGGWPGLRADKVQEQLQDEVSLTQRERVARTSRRCRYSFWIPLNGDWSHTVVSFENLALVVALCKGRSKFFHLDFSRAWYLCVWLQGRFCLISFRWIPSEVNYSDEGSRFFDHDYDPSKSLLHVLAQRLTRSSPAPTCDQDCLCPSLMHLEDLDVGNVDLTSHIHVPAVSVQSNAPFNDLCNRLSHLKVLPLLGKMIATEVVEIKCFMSLWVRVGYLLAWLGVVQKPVTHRVS